MSQRLYDLKTVGLQVVPDIDFSRPARAGQPLLAALLSEDGHDLRTAQELLNYKKVGLTMIHTQLKKGIGKLTNPGKDFF